MHTVSGVIINLLDVQASDLNIEDIATGLYHTNRFNGQTERPYNVLSHSMCAAEMAPDDKKLEALLHDASEAYIGDMTTPVKELFPEFVVYEDKLLAMIMEKFNTSTYKVENGRYVKSPVMLAIDKRLGQGENFVLRPRCAGVYDSEVADLMYRYWNAQPRDFIKLYKVLSTTGDTNEQ